MYGSTELYIELYKRKEYDKIAIGKDPDGFFYYPTPKQILALQLLNDNETRFIGYGGSARSGKTVIEAVAVTFDCLAYPGIAWGLARMELTRLKKTVIKTLFTLFDFYGIKKDVDFTYNQQLNMIQFVNGSEIFLIDTAFQPSDPLYTRFGGFELTRCAVDESNESKEDAVGTLYSRCGWRKNDVYGLKKKMFETFNPDKGHVYSRYYKPFRDKKETNDKKFIKALPSDNPNKNVKEWIQDILAEGNKIRIERLIYGNFEYDDDPRKLIDYDKICNIFSNSFVKESEQHFISCDAARLGGDKATICVWYGLVVVEMLSIDKCLVNELVDKINELALKHSVPKGNIIVDTDGVGGGVTDYVKAKSFINNSKPIGIIDKNYGNLKTQCYFKLAEYINNDKIWIKAHLDSKQIEEIKEELEVVKIHDVDFETKIYIIKKEEVKELINRSPDWTDSLMMRMYFELRPPAKYA